MAYELREGQFNVFENSFKEKENQPDMKGTLLLDGKVRDVAMWRKETKGGKMFYSGSIQDKREQEPKPVRPKTPFEDMDSDCPF